jgi:hypothetical protein
MRGRADDGAELSSAVPVTFVVATGLHVICAATLTTDGLMVNPAGQCGGHYPVFTDSVWQWKIVFASDAGNLGASSATTSVGGDGSVTGGVAGGYLTLQSGSSPGLGQVQISSRQFMESIPVRVVSPADVMAGELELVTDIYAHDGIEQDITTLGPAPNTLWYGDAHHRSFDGDAGNTNIVSRLTLTDGSAAFGGAGLFLSDHSDVLKLFGVSSGGSQLQLTALQLNPASVGTATGSANIGAAQVAWPIQVISRLGI